MLVRLLGWPAALAGLSVTVAIIPLSAAVGKRLAQARKDMVNHSDARVKLATEVITGGYIGNELELFKVAALVSTYVMLYALFMPLICFANAFSFLFRLFHAFFMPFYCFFMLFYALSLCPVFCAAGRF
jgi:hypothetical protein